ncbi:MAG: YraN family protein [Actinomycetota bacterium]|nr:YraN family protein [Actinomycetota bacterium]
MTNQELKNESEQQAADLLERLGMRILARNYRLRFGEIDLVAIDGDTLTFVEVKARTNNGMIDPFEAVDHAKQKKLRRLAAAFIALERPHFVDCRFDVVSVLKTDPPQPPQHLIDAF